MPFRSKVRREIEKLLAREPGLTTEQMRERLPQYNGDSIKAIMYKMARRQRLVKRREKEGELLRFYLPKRERMEETYKRILEEKDQQILRLMREVQEMSEELDRWKYGRK